MQIAWRDCVAATWLGRDKMSDCVKNFGSWQDAEKLRQWSFLQRTPEQRLQWLVEALSIAYQSGALRPPIIDTARTTEAKIIK